MIRMELGDGGVVVVVFSLEADPSRGSVSVVGDFNDWDPLASPMTASTDDPSVLEVTMRLEAGCRYEFRYLSDAVGWFDDEAADEFCPNPHGGCNSVMYLAVASDGDIVVVDLSESDTSILRG